MRGYRRNQETYESFILLIGEGDILGHNNRFIDYLPVPLRYMVLLSCFTELRSSARGDHLFLQNRFWFEVSRFYVDESLQADKAHEAWNFFINKRLEKKSTVEGPRRPSLFNDAQISKASSS